jgi:hypothetical protein
MNGRSTTALSWKRALIMFVGAYVLVIPLAFGLYLALAAIMGVALTDQFSVTHDPAYSIAQKLYPLLNLFVWATFAWLYFRGRKPECTPRFAVRLGSFWLGLVLPLDLVAFVLIKSPLSLSPHDFYVAQAPWIYLTYVAVLVAPLCVVALSRATSAMPA